MFFRDVQARKTFRIANDGTVAVDAAIGGTAAGMAVGPDGRVYVADAASARILAYDAARRSTVIATGIRGRYLTVAHSGRIYVTEPGSSVGNPSRIWLISPDGKKSVVDTSVNGASGIALTPDGLWLSVAESNTHWGYSYQVQPDGTLQHKARFYWFHEPDAADDSGTGSICMDRDGRLYAATRMGVEILDRNGRTRAILPVPGGEATSVYFGGSAFDTLYVTTRNNVYSRKLKAIGAPAWAAPFKLPPWGAG